MPEQTYRVWLTSNKAVVVNRAELQRLIHAGKVVTIKEVGMKQPIQVVPGKPPPAPFRKSYPLKNGFKKHGHVEVAKRRW